MSELEIEGTFEEQWGIMKAAVKKHDAAIYGNGKEGLLDFMAGLKGQLRLVVALLLFLSTLAAVGTLIVTIKSVKSGKIELPKITHSDPKDPVLSFTHKLSQDAGLPSTYQPTR